MSLVRGKNAKVLEKSQNSAAAADPKCSHKVIAVLAVLCVLCGTAVPRKGSAGQELSASSDQTP